MNDFEGIMRERRRGVMHVPYEFRLSDGRWRRDSHTRWGMRTYRQARASQAAMVALMNREGEYPERLGWSEETR